jgi:hypothetical protein
MRQVSDGKRVLARIKRKVWMTSTTRYRTSFQRQASRPNRDLGDLGPEEGQGRMTTAEAVPYLQWKKDVAHHDYAAASGYLSIRFGESRAREVSEKLQKLQVITRRANDILRATSRDPLPLSDPGVLKDLKKVLAGEKLSPVLVAEGDIADGYHRVSLAYALDPYADVPLKLG